MPIYPSEPNIESTTLADAGGVNLASVSAGGALKVDGSAVTQPVSGSVSITNGSGVSAVNIQDGGNTITVDGTVIVTQATGTNLHAVLDSGTLTSITNALPTGTNTLGSISLGNNTGKSVVMKTGTLVTTSVTANQVILTYTVTSGKTLYLEYINIQAAQTTPSGGTGIVLGTVNFQNPSGTNVISSRFIGGGSEQFGEITIPFSEPIPVVSATVVQVVTTPAATSSMTWIANFGGYER